MITQERWCGMVDILAELVKKVYAGKVAMFFEKVKALNLTDVELAAVPSLFLPGWGERYSSSCFKVAIAGKETWDWGTDIGDSLKCDLEAHENGRYDIMASCRRFRDEGPAKWYNTFWQYPATALGKLFGCTRDEVLQKDGPLLRSIAWFNGHAIETKDSKGVKDDISEEKMRLIQDAADESGLSDFETFTSVFRPNVIMYFYRNQSLVPDRNFPSDIEHTQDWGPHNLVKELRIGGRTLMLQLPHTTYLAQKHISQAYVADLICDVLKARNIRVALCDKDAALDFYRMNAVEWMAWVEFVRNESQKYPDMDNKTLARHLIAVVACELAKCNATMNAQTLVLILNEVDRFRHDNWQYSPECRGPCSSVRGAWNEYVNNGKNEEAEWIARAFTKLNGCFAYE